MNQTNFEKYDFDDEKIKYNNKAAFKIKKF